MPGTWTTRQRHFVEAMLDEHGPGHLCMTRAARIAGYAWPGKQGPRLMTMPHVHAEVERRFRVVLDAIRGQGERLERERMRRPARRR